MPKPGVGSSKKQFFLYDNVDKKFVEIHDGFVCGRLEGDLKFPDDKVVSRKQCKFSISGNDVYIEDLGSTNRTKVNSVPSEAGHRRRIQLYDVIEFGSQRLILSHQDKFPANVQDRIKTGKMYQAARRDDGQLTSELSQDLTKKTLIMIDKATFRRLRLEETFIKDRRKRKRGNAESRSAKPAGTGTPGGRFSIIVLAFLCFVCWIGPLATLWIAGALDSGLPVEASEIILGLAIMLAVGGVLALGFYIRMFRHFVRGPFGRAVIVLFLVGLAGLCGVFLTKKTGLLTRVSTNLTVARCLHSWDDNLCPSLVALDHNEWTHLPPNLRTALEAKLHH
jgi:hypothetical protein